LPHPSSTDHKGNSTTSIMRNASILTALLSHCHSINRWGPKNPTMLQLLESAHKASNSKPNHRERSFWNWTLDATNWCHW
jgi:hypothetical protein